jgi:hypothetical protein
VPLSSAETEGLVMNSKRHAVTIMLTDEHLSKMVTEHLLAEDEIDDQAKVARVVLKLVDLGLGLPEKPWHDWDDWAKGLE